MQRKWVFVIALLLILLTTLLIIGPNTLAYARNGMIIDTPTPTPDANAILNKANDASNQAQNLITYIPNWVYFICLTLQYLWSTINTLSNRSY
jgi:hypothetical protein